MYYQSSENKGADQLRGYREADLRLCFRIYAKSRFSHDAAQMKKKFDFLNFQEFSNFSESFGLTLLVPLASWKLVIWTSCSSYLK